MSLQLLANVIVLAAIYALVGSGYVLIYRVSRVLNLAHGELMMVGAYLLVALAGVFPTNPPLALLLAAICGLVMGIAVYAVLMRWMTGEAVLAAVLITIALGILLRGLTILIWTTPAVLSRRVVRLAQSASAFGARRTDFLGESRARVCLTVVVYLALLVFLRFTRWGVRMRAAGQNPLLAEQRGIRLHGVYALAWGLSTFTASLAGMLLSLDAGVDFEHGDHRAKSISGGAGRRARQPARRGARRIDRGGRGDRRHSICRSAVVGRGAVHCAPCHPRHPALGIVWQPRTARSGLR